MRFQFTLPQPRKSAYQIITILLMIMNVLMFGLLYTKATPASREASLCVFGFTLGLTSVIVLLIRQWSDKLLSYRAEMAFFIMAILWFLLGATWQGVGMLILALMGLVTFRKTRLEIDEQGIRLGSFPPRSWQWNELSNLMLKDGILTLDLKSNKLMQWTIEREQPAAIGDEAGFNEFCRRHLPPPGF